MVSGGNIPAPGILSYVVPARSERRSGAWGPTVRARRDEVPVVHRATGGAAIDPAAAFEQQMLPHLASALTLARYLLREVADAEDAVQEAYLQAVRHFGGFRGENARAWLLTIVRRVCYAWTERERRYAWTSDEDDVSQLPSPTDDPEQGLVRRETQEQLARAVDALPLPFREVIVMREIQQLSYKEIASVTGVPVGTVMSRLARARARLQRALEAQGMDG